MVTRQERWYKEEIKLIEKYLPRIKKILNKEDLILNPVPVEINKRKGMTRLAGRWDGNKIELFKDHYAGLTKGTLLHELLHAFISQNQLYEYDKKSELFNKLVLNLNTKKLGIGACHGAYKWIYRCSCGAKCKTNAKYINGWTCAYCGRSGIKVERYLTKKIILENISHGKN